MKKLLFFIPFTLILTSFFSCISSYQKSDYYDITNYSEKEWKYISMEGASDLSDTFTTSHSLPNIGKDDYLKVEKIKAISNALDTFFSHYSEEINSLINKDKVKRKLKRELLRSDRLFYEFIDFKKRRKHISLNLIIESVYLSQTEEFLGEIRRKVVTTKNVNTGLFSHSSKITREFSEYKYKGSFCFRIIGGIRFKGKETPPISILTEPCGQITYFQNWKK